MILENGEWLNIENSESLEMTKLKWKADSIIRLPHLFFPVTITNTTAHPTYGPSYYGPLFVELIEKGLIKPTEEMLALLTSAGFLPSDDESDQNTPLNPFVVPEELAQVNEDALPPSSHSINRNPVWLLWLVPPVVVGSGFALYLKRKRKRR